MKKKHLLGYIEGLPETHQSSVLAGQIATLVCQGACGREIQDMVDKRRRVEQDLIARAAFAYGWWRLGLSHNHREERELERLREAVGRVVESLEEDRGGFLGQDACVEITETTLLHLWRRIDTLHSAAP